MHIKACAAAALALLVAGCATQPIPTSQAIPVSASKVHDTTYTKPVPGYGVVIVKRDSGFGGSACSTKLFANGKLTAELSTSEKINLYFPEGMHVISAWPNNPCGGGMVEVEAQVKVDKVLTYRIGYGSNGDFGLYPTAF